VKITHHSNAKKHLLLHKKKQHPSFSEHTNMTIMKYALIPHFHFAPSYAVAQSIFDNPKKMLAGDVPFFFAKKTVQD
jgi:hypothetical protein